MSAAKNPKQTDFRWHDFWHFFNLFDVSGGRKAGGWKRKEVFFFILEFIFLGWLPSSVGVAYYVHPISSAANDRQVFNVFQRQTSTSPDLSTHSNSAEKKLGKMQNLQKFINRGYKPENLRPIRTKKKLLLR